MNFYCLKMTHSPITSRM